MGRRHCNASKHDWSDRETWTTFAQTQLNGTKRDLSEVKFAVEAIEMDETVKNRFKDARIARAKNKLKDARIAKIKNESKVEKLRWIHTMD